MFVRWVIPSTNNALRFHALRPPNAIKEPSSFKEPDARGNETTTETKKSHKKELQLKTVRQSTNIVENTFNKSWHLNNEKNCTDVNQMTDDVGALVLHASSRQN